VPFFSQGYVWSDRQQRGGCVEPVFVPILFSGHYCAGKDTLYLADGSKHWDKLSIKSLVLGKPKYLINTTVASKLVY